jgi:hypothetical protein
VLAEPSRSEIAPRHTPSPAELREQLAQIRERGWALTDQELANGVRSVATPLRDGSGRTRAALNVTVHVSPIHFAPALDSRRPIRRGNHIAASDPASPYGRPKPEEMSCRSMLEFRRDWHRATSTASALTTASPGHSSPTKLRSYRIVVGLGSVGQTAPSSSGRRRGWPPRARWRSEDSVGAATLQA